MYASITSEQAINSVHNGIPCVLHKACGTIPSIADPKKENTPKTEDNNKFVVP